MSKVRAILITGLSGTGKTTLARKLARRYGVALLAKDIIKEPLLDVIGLDDHERMQSRKLSNASFAVLFALARELAAARVSFILEGNFRAGEHESALGPLFPSCDVAQVLCRACEPERIARLTARSHDAERHRGHQDTDLVRQSNPATGRFLDLPGARWLLDTSGDVSSARDDDDRQTADLEGAAMVAEPALLDTLDHWIGIQAQTHS